ncbi:OmpA family protein [Maribacter sp. 2308TA10-17]|uniref:OmpA family protein n=1 Tax=Maribacter sp. 2308TA10-17 TaxID=3386276 RepID=UPI0039BD91E3
MLLKLVKICYNYTLFVLLLLGCQVTIGQNLVMNPSFEDFVQCPQEYGTFQEDVLFWTKPTFGSTDYFNSCSSTMTVDRNFTGFQAAFHGKAYAGIYAYGPKDYREYIQGELKQRLEKGRNYIVSAMVSLSEKSEYAIDELGFLFTGQEVDLHTKRNIPHSLMVREGISHYSGVIKRSFFSDKKYWIEIEGEYTADGTERYITFGNFKGNRMTRTNSTGPNLKKAAYYYIDMISVEEANKPFNFDEIYVFEGLNFDVDGFKIEGEVVTYLQPLIKYLKENPQVNIVIYGHTDNIGDREYNKALSERRAKTLGLFLVDNGLSPFRIAWQGFGDGKPVVTNDTEQGREQNRRVEFIISKKKREFYASGLFEDEDN